MTLQEEIAAIKAEAAEREKAQNMKQCRYCQQWYNRKTTSVELYGYCSISCLEIDYASFRHMKRKLEGDLDV